MVKTGEHPEDCWQWLGNVNKRTGYGKKTVNGKAVLAHRWMYETLFGVIPNGKVINHKCSKRDCVNPAHLEVVTQAENCRHGAATKLTPDQVAEIRAAYPVPWGQKTKLAKKYGVSPALLSDIWYGRAWS